MNTVTLPGNTSVCIQNTGQLITIKAVGIACCLGELVEQIGWITSALHNSPSSEQPACITPFLTSTVKALASQENLLGESICFNMMFESSCLPNGIEDRPGSCWLKLFNNPGIIGGYPILRRKEGCLGLEASLDLLAVLANSARVTTWNDRIFIKGFSTMLTPMKKEGDCVVWHALVNEDGEHISYSDSRIARSQSEYPTDLSITDLPRLRHVVGWCSEAANYIG